MVTLNSKTKTILVSIWFEIAWIGCVFGPLWLALVCLAVWIAIAVYFSTPIFAIFILAGAGLVMDGTLVHFGVYQFDDGPIPIWLLALWFGFAVYAIVMQKLVNFKPTYWLAPALAVLAPLSYWVGVQTDKLTWPLGTMTTVMICALAWFIYGAILNYFYAQPQGKRLKEV